MPHPRRQKGEEADYPGQCVLDVSELGWTVGQYVAGHYGLVEPLDQSNVIWQTGLSTPRRLGSEPSPLPLLGWEAAPVRG